MLLFDGDRNTETCPFSSSQRSWRLFGMSLHTRNRPWLHHAGPSDHMAPVQRRWMAVLLTRSGIERRVVVMMSGSGYPTGGAPGSVIPHGLMGAACFALRRRLRGGEAGRARGDARRHADDEITP